MFIVCIYVCTWYSHNSSLNFCDDNLSISVLPDSVGYFCSRISPADTIPTAIVGHSQPHPVNRLLLAKPCPLRSIALSIWLNWVFQHCMLMQSTQLGYSWVWASVLPLACKLEQFIPTWSHKSMLMKARCCAFSSPTQGGLLPHAPPCAERNTICSS